MSTKTQAYPSDLTDDQWEILAEIMEKKTGPGHPLQHCLRTILNAIFYLVRTGIQWRALPHDFPKWSTVYYHFRKWSLDGTWEQINEIIRRMEREKQGKNPEPTGIIIDSQSAKTTEAGGVRGYDVGKNVSGRKRHTADDTNGNLLSVVVNAANTDDREGAKAVLQKLPQSTIDSIQKIWADGGYQGRPFATWLQENFDCTIEIKTRPPNSKGFVLVPVRWIVERTFAWLGRYRRLSKDYERCTKSSEGVIYLASILTMLKRISPA